MIQYREILRLTALGLSQRNIMQRINVSQKTVVKVQRRAKEINLSWPLDESLIDNELRSSPEFVFSCDTECREVLIFYIFHRSAYRIFLMNNDCF